MSQSFDREVIVIGGGPAGSTVARYAALGGADVLVIDGRDPIGTPLQCGELVPTNDEMRGCAPTFLTWMTYSKLRIQRFPDIPKKCTLYLHLAGH